MRSVVGVKTQQQSRDNFSLWLKKVPLDFLEDVYRHYKVRRDIPVSPFAIESAAPQTLPTPTNLSPPMQPIVLRRSVFYLISSLLGIEIFFDLIYFGLRFFLMFVQMSQIASPIRIESLYFGIFLLLNLVKVIFMVVTSLEWISFTYEITGKEIVSRYGILNHKEKVYLCTYIQEVMYTQSLMGKLFNYGTIELHNPTFDEIVYLDNIPNPRKHVDTIKEALPQSEKREYMPMKMETAS